MSQKYPYRFDYFLNRRYSNHIRDYFLKNKNTNLRVSDYKVTERDAQLLQNSIFNLATDFVIKRSSVKPWTIAII